MRIFTLIALLMVATMSFAEVEIAAVIPKGSFFLVTSIDKTQAKQFPLASYDVDIMTSDFKVLKSNDKSLDISDYNSLMLKGKLKLIAYNPKTEHYQFKFILEPISGLMRFSVISTSDIKSKGIRGDVLFDANNKSSIILEGEIQHNDKLVSTKENPYLMFLNSTKDAPTEFVMAIPYDMPITIKAVKEI